MSLPIDARANHAQNQSRVASLDGHANGDRGTPSLDELAQELRRTIPLPSSISRLEPNQVANVVELTWQSRQFVVKPSLEVFELKGRTLFVNGTSMLIQTVLARQESTSRLVKALDGALERVESLFKSRRQQDAFTLLASVKATVTKHAGVKSSSPFDRNGARMHSYAA
ncbi:MAG: hypothetical protein HY735_34975 [Verrucomicrobia bacterium]|nr:hypothetical protein [Verrucomicrobiota bacterium]